MELSGLRSPPHTQGRGEGAIKQSQVAPPSDEPHPTVAEQFPPVEVWRAAAHPASLLHWRCVSEHWQQRYELPDQSAHGFFLLSSFPFFFFLQLSIDLNHAPSFNPTLNSTRLHLLDARWTRPRDATFLYTSSPYWVPRRAWGRGGYIPVLHTFFSQITPSSEQLITEKVTNKVDYLNKNGYIKL